MVNRILRIDLSGRSYRIEDIPDKIISQYLGGRGLGAYLLYNSVPAGIDPLGEQNHLIFTAGPSNGTKLAYSSKTAVNTKSPLTGIHLYAMSSGTTGHQIRKAGLWAVDIYADPGRPCTQSIVEAARIIRKPLAVTLFALPEFAAEEYDFLAQNNIAAFGDARRAVAALARVSRYASCAVGN